ncbi:cation diffusion facilitator family transporter [Sutcliffiella rhizosphaerae]|uniref:Cadmium, cobalt and zinc/H(+)-K(+) antiporter n=1 Tax=Sutcliffiella rhizosphaerae TaxID=2880967 RepID=A0ABN8AHS0_9BACI|nr:cation diffusion facilitator family transporter [Sutcliffiella rhizosphaerae]CAG9623676.1 Cadmium, cobalt and zinc/H(+)-K(+) antiporter [Sutcliffiella rhizosphaerae]
MSANHQHHSKNKKALMLSFIIIFTYMFVEVIGGILTNSLALLSDAGHMLSDAVALGLSYVALAFGEKKATLTKTFGYKRFEILAAFINGLTLIGISVYIFYEAYRRIQDPPDVVSGGMLTIAVIGLIVNIIAAYILMSADKEHNLNVKSAFLHVIGDLLGSVGAIVAALLILFFGWNMADPIASVVVAVLIIISGYRVTRDSFHILMEGAPRNLKVEDIRHSLLQIDGVKEVHDLHIWSITSEFPALSCHLVIDDSISHQKALAKANEILQHTFHLKHTTIQIDLFGRECGDNCN